MRKFKKEIIIKDVAIGGNHPIAIQSMTNTKTSNIDETVKQIKELENNGCNIIRVAIVNESDALALKEIKKQIKVPIVADIHFDYKLAILSIQNGADKIRINPGNIGSKENLLKIINVAKEYNIPIRIGVNSGSIEQKFLEKYNGPTINAMIDSLDSHIRFFEENNFFNLVLSIKTTNLNDTIEVNKILNEKYDYPLHIGLTESGTKTSGTVKSSYVLGTLLNLNIGDTIRVSLTSDPVDEIHIAKEILAMTYHIDKPTLISCPTCGRTSYNMMQVVSEVEKYLNTIDKKITVAVMGCVVNGPGEAKHADIGIAGGVKKGVLFKKGEIIRTISEEDIVKELIKEIEKM
jgi:(E)-4-hydroxy-3-methylbut-2-enyl-diphosphate synthase